MSIRSSYPWHIAANTQNARPCFARFAAGAAVGCELALMSAAGLWDVLAWVLLPSRFEAVIAPLRGRLDDTAPRFLAHVADRVARVDDDPRPLWAGRIAYRALSEEGEAEAMSRALLRKPIRADLVERLADYPFWDSVWVGAPARAPAVPTVAAVPAVRTVPAVPAVSAVVARTQVPHASGQTLLLPPRAPAPIPWERVTIAGS
ncbi:MAG TPA: hypothetical protein VF925_06150 [Casimicrobiaceae bacterium]